MTVATSSGPAQRCSSPGLLGSVHVITGPMFAGKTEALLSTVRQREARGRQTAVFYPIVDCRTDGGRIASHEGDFETATPFRDSMELLELHDENPIDLVVIDEAQFSDSSLPRVVDTLRRRGVTVYCAGLDRDFQGRPFGHMPALVAIADSVYCLTAVCRCGSPASMSQRVDSSGNEILSGSVVEVGGAERYEARCSVCFVSTTGVVQDARLRSAVLGP